MKKLKINQFGIRLSGEYNREVVNLYCQGPRDVSGVEALQSVFPIMRQVNICFMSKDGPCGGRARELGNHLRSGPDHDLSVVNLLDLQIFKIQEKVYTRTYFKDTNRNGYILISSCHHRQWIQNIPKGQIIWLRKNCYFDKDYEEWSEVLIKRFIDKRYKRK